MKLLTTLTQSKWCYKILLPSPAYLVGGFKNSLVLLFRHATIQKDELQNS